MPQEHLSVTGRHKLACIIIGRNLGDAVIQSKFTRQLIERGYADRYIVWTRPQVGFLYSSLPNCEVVTSPFPIGTNKQFDFKGFLRFYDAVRYLRKVKPSISIDMIGDFRERIFARLIGHQTHQYIGWESGHPFSRIIRNPFGAPAPVCTVPTSVTNLYKAYGSFINALQPREPPAFDTAQLTAANKPTKLKRIGIHPFASQDCKLWPDTNWRELATWLLAKGVNVTVYGAPNERDSLLRIFGNMPIQPEYFTKSIPELDQDVGSLDLMIGLDSFSVHMAERNGVKSIMLNACNHPTLWVPTQCESISMSGGCRSYPCMNVPSCGRGPEKYACIRAIDAAHVQDKVSKLVSL